MFAHKKNYGRAGYVDDPLPNIVYMAIRMPACIVCSGGSRISKRGVLRSAREF